MEFSIFTTNMRIKMERPCFVRQPVWRCLKLATVLKDFGLAATHNSKGCRIYNNIMYVLILICN